VHSKSAIFGVDEPAKMTALDVDYNILCSIAFERQIQRRLHSAYDILGNFSLKLR